MPTFNPQEGARQHRERLQAGREARQARREAHRNRRRGLSETALSDAPPANPPGQTPGQVTEEHRGDIVQVAGRPPPTGEHCPRGTLCDGGSIVLRSRNHA